MNRNEKRMIVVNGMYPFCQSMASVFLSVYLYSCTRSLPIMAGFTMIRVIAIPVFFSIGGRMSRKLNWTKEMAAGLVLMILELVFVLGIRNGFSIHPELILIPAFLYGAGEGLFWLGANTLNQLVTTRETLMQFLSFQGILGNLMNLASPMVSAFILSLAGSDAAGYEVCFLIVLFIYGMLMVIADRIRVDVKQEPYDVLHCFHDRAPYWHMTMIHQMLYGMRDSFLMMLAGLLVYDAIGRKGTLYSILTAVFSLITIIGYELYRRYVTEKKLYPVYALCGVLLSLALLVLGFERGSAAGLFYGIVNAACIPGWSNGYTAIVMHAVDHYREKENIIGRVIAREYPLAMGRMLGMALILVLHLLMPSVYIAVSVCLISAAVMIDVLYIGRFQSRNPQAML